MPLYEYTCKKCDHSFEVLLYDGEEVECPECHGKRVERQISVPARPKVAAQALPTSCGEGPPCGATGCRRQG
jgi:putative FmdB family regulatory protein